MSAMTEVTICSGYRPGLIGGLVSLHADYYARHWGFGLAFEALVARESAALIGRGSARDGIWSAWQGGRLIGAAAIDGHAGGHAGDDGNARLRFFIVDERAQGSGIGRRLLAAALQHCDSLSVDRVWLTTFAGLDAARRLYEQAGFVLTHEAPDQTWGRVVLEQRFERQQLNG
jgi:GNAT superfamily N-acetyltransferase